MRNHQWYGDCCHNTMPAMTQHDLHAIYVQAQWRNNSARHCTCHRLPFAYIRKPENHEVRILLSHYAVAIFQWASRTALLIMKKKTVCASYILSKIRCALAQINRFLSSLCFQTATYTSPACICGRNQKQNGKKLTLPVVARILTRSFISTIHEIPIFCAKKQPLRRAISIPQPQNAAY